jgi:hypothetical protein
MAHLWDLLLDRIEEADEPLVAMVLHVAADDGAIEDVESWEQRGGAVTFRIHTSSSRGLGFIGNPGRVRSSAWIWLFSLIERTTGTPRTSENCTRPGAIRAGNVTGLGERGCAAAAALKQSLRCWAGIALVIYSLCIWPSQFQTRNRKKFTWSLFRQPGSITVHARQCSPLLCGGRYSALASWTGHGEGVRNLRNNTVSYRFFKDGERLK